MPAVRLFLAVAALVGLAAVATPVPGAAAEDSAEVVRVALPADDGTLTPYTFDVGYPLVTLVYDTLLWRDPDGVPRPWLAESVDTSADGRTVTIRLREGARWHDGEPVTAADVAFTFGFLTERFHPRFTPQLAAVDTATAADERTVSVTLSRPSAGFVDQPLADVPILPAHLWEGLPDDEAAPDGLPVGSGPYRLVAHDPGQGYRFEADPGYLHGAPRVDVVEALVVGDLEAMLDALRRGDVDVVPASLPAGVTVTSPSVEVAHGSLYAGTALLLNTRRPPFDDPGARRAVAAALDLDRIARAAGGTAADSGFVHPAARWAPADPVHRTDLDAAGGALAALPAVTVLAPDDDPVRGEAARQVALALERAGADADVQRLERAALARRLGEDGDETDFDAAVWSLPPLASHDPDFLAVLFGSDPDRAVLNATGYASADFDALAEQVATTLDPAQRQAAVDEQQTLLAADAPAVALLYADGAFPYRPDAYDGWVYVDGTGILDKQSLLHGPEQDPSPARPGGQRTQQPAGDAPAAPFRLPGPLGLAALALLGLAVALGAVELARRR